MTTTETNVYKSRWGYHSCDYETFLKLKKLHKLYWQTVYRFAAWERWDRKLPHNRVIRRKLRSEDGTPHGYEVVGMQPEPKYCPYFVVERYGWKRIASHGIVEAYRTARTPRSKAENVKPLDLSVERIDKILAEVKGWL